MFRALHVGVKFNDKSMNTLPYPIKCYLCFQCSYYYHTSTISSISKKKKKLRITKLEYLLHQFLLMIFNKWFIAYATIISTLNLYLYYLITSKVFGLQSLKYKCNKPIQYKIQFSYIFPFPHSNSFSVFGFDFVNKIEWIGNIFIKFISNSNWFHIIYHKNFYSIDSQ